MRRFRFGVALVVVLLCLPAVAPAQGLYPFQELGAFNLAEVDIVSSVKFGYQNMRLNMSLPVPYIENSYFILWETGGVDLKLEDAGMWIGAVGLDARWGPFIAFLGGETNAQKKARVRSQEGPHRMTAWFKPVEWTVQGLEWWTMDGGLGYYFNQSAAIVGGVRLERLSFRLTDARDSAGFLEFWHRIIPEDYSADFLTRMCVPYLGVRIDGGYFNGLLRFSPLAFSYVKFPFSYTGDFMSADNMIDYERAEYTFKRTCLWVDASLESAMEVTPNLRCSLWVKGNWHWLKGKGYEEHEYQYWPEVPPPPATGYAIPPHGTMHGSAEGTCTFSTVAAGVGGEYIF